MKLPGPIVVSTLSLEGLLACFNDPRNYVAGSFCPVLCVLNLAGSTLPKRSVWIEARQSDLLWSSRLGGVQGVNYPLTENYLVTETINSTSFTNSVLGRTGPPPRRTMTHCSQTRQEFIGISTTSHFLARLIKWEPVSDRIITARFVSRFQNFVRCHVLRPEKQCGGRRQRQLLRRASVSCR